MITQHSTIGFIGLGAMGQRMARRLLNSGFKLFAYDHTIRKTAELAASGAIIAPSLRQLARKSEVIISCLPNDEAVLSVYQGPEGVLACANPREHRDRDEHRLAGYVAIAASDGQRAGHRSPGCRYFRQHARR